MTKDELVTMIAAYGLARMRVRAVYNRQSYLEAAADLWDAEEALERAALRLEHEAEE